MKRSQGSKESEIEKINGPKQMFTLNGIIVANVFYTQTKENNSVKCGNECILHASGNTAQQNINDLAAKTQSLIELYYLPRGIKTKRKTHTLGFSERALRKNGRKK